MTQVSFTKTITVDALTADGSDANEVKAFLEGSGWLYTETGTANGYILGIVHQEGKETFSATRKYFTKESVIVKVDGRYSGVMNRAAYDKLYA